MGLPYTDSQAVNQALDNLEHSATGRPQNLALVHVEHSTPALSQRLEHRTLGLLQGQKLENRDHSATGLFQKGATALVRQFEWLSN